MVGVIILLLCATLLAPIPFSHIIPLLVIMLLALALFAAMLSLVITVAAVWGTIEAGLLL